MIDLSSRMDEFSMNTASLMMTDNKSNQISGYRSDEHRKKYREYLKKLEEKNRFIRAASQDHIDKEDLIKQRENGFQLYVNGAHTNRPSTSMHHLSNRSKDRRRQWTSKDTTKIKTDQGAILTDLSLRPPSVSIRRPQISPEEILNLPIHPPIGQICDTYRLPPSSTSMRVDQSWMPEWYRKAQDDDLFDNGARLAGGDLTKTTSTTQATNKNILPDASRRPPKAIDSLDLENFLQPKEVHIASNSDEQKPSTPQLSTKTTKTNDGQGTSADWLEKSITQIDLFRRRHRGMLENEKVEEYFTSPAAKGENEHDEDQFVIPELPCGEQLVFNLKTTWGDRHYIGLNGIEIFSSEGHLVPIKKITADPPDINILPEYGNDPRVVTNLIDGVNKTRDDIHMWLAPFTASRNHLISITFEQRVKIALIRIWNYNKSRIYSTRGVKDVEINLDGHPIFKGEITQACGNTLGSNDPSLYGETILFTTDEAVLEKIAISDEMYVDQEMGHDENEPNRIETNRPPSPRTDVRPMTRATLRRPFTALRSANTSQIPEFYGRKLILTVTETWGDPDYCGLTGLEIVDVNDADCTIHSHQTIPTSASQTMERLFDSENVTCDKNHMWLCPFNRQEKVRLMITLSVSKKLHGLRIWNYNASPEDSYRGIKRLHVQLNDKIISPRQGFLLRRAPGHCYFDFAQEIVFAHAKMINEEHNKKLANPIKTTNTNDSDISMPNGFIYEFQLHSTHGDTYYIGLNGIEFYNENGEQIGLTEQNVVACPHSVNTLNPGTNDDVRTPDKLIDGVNEDIDGTHSWIAPILPNVINRLFIIFDRPTSVSMIKIWNYSKTVNRGVREISLLVDDLLVWTGILDKVNENSLKQQLTFNTILFSNERILTDHEKQTVVENKTSNEYSTDDVANRHQTIDFSKRPTTSVPRNARK